MSAPEQLQHFRNVHPNWSWTSMNSHLGRLKRHHFLTKQTEFGCEEDTHLVCSLGIFSSVCFLKAGALGWCREQPRKSLLWSRLPRSTKKNTNISLSPLPTRMFYFMSFITSVCAQMIIFCLPLNTIPQTWGVFTMLKTCAWMKYCGTINSSDSSAGCDTASYFGFHGMDLSLRLTTACNSFWSLNADVCNSEISFFTMYTHLY